MALEAGAGGTGTWVGGKGVLMVHSIAGGTGSGLGSR
jgi:hypothetical protein